MTKEQEEAIKILVNMKKENESLAMRIFNNRLDFRIVWSESDLKNMAKTSQECAKKIRAIETVLSILEEKDKQIADLEKSVEQIYEDYQDIGKIAFDDGEKIEMLEKQIDLMAEFIEERLDTRPFEDYNYDLNCEKECNDNYIRCWKQYFENKVRQERDKFENKKKLVKKLAYLKKSLVFLTIKTNKN